MTEPSPIEPSEITVSFAMAAEDYPITVELWAAGADRRGEPTCQAVVQGSGVMAVPRLGPETWARFTLATGEIHISAPPGEDERDF